MNVLKHILFLLILLIPTVSALAQEEGTAVSSLPASHQLSGFSYEPQMWNNCGPATLTNGLSFFGYTDNQRRAANYLKPDIEDKNVTPWQMIDFVNTQVPEIPVYAVVRAGGTLDRLKTLLANEFPVIIEEGYDPPPHDLGWMGHYLLLTGYDDNNRTFNTHDSYIGANTSYTYDHVDEFWQHFNRTYIVLYRQEREEELMTLLGEDADPFVNAQRALEQARAEATADRTDAFAWFNMGSNFVAMARFYPEGSEEARTQYGYAATAFDEARKQGLPWRMLWYQFGPLEAYNAVGRYGDTISLARATIDTKGPSDEYLPVEEIYYYAGVAREALGETNNAVANYQTALLLNNNFTPAREALDTLQNSG